MKIKLIPILVITLLVLSIAVTASMLIPASDKAKEKSPVIDDDGGLERVDFIHYARPDKPPKGGSKGENCYKLLGVKWKSLPVDYVINPSNSGLDPVFVTSAISTSAETWDVATASELFNDAYGIDSTAQYGILDSKNAIAFGNYPQENVIAVTSIWYMRRGKQIVEFDMLFDTDYQWGDATVDPLVMDLQNIATHELGHSVGLGDIYSTTCETVTMYGYSTEGETSKRILETPDIAGLQSMYG